MTATIWRSCPSCGANFEQPDDPRLCSHACQQAAYRARQRHGAGQHQQHRPPPGSTSGHRPGTTSGDEMARIRRIVTALLRKAAAASYPHDAAACREKAEALRAKYGL